MNDQDPHALYRFFDDEGNLLYIGITLDLPGRLKAHRREKLWWAEVSRIEIQHFDSREAVELAEQQAIAANSPRYNVIHNRTDGANAYVGIAEEWRLRDLEALELYQQGLTWAEISRRWGISSKAVARISARLRKARLVEPRPKVTQ